MSRPIGIDREELNRMYLVEHMTDRQIAAFYNCDKQTVYLARKKWEIEAIPKWQRHVCEPTVRQRQIIYGTILGDAHIEDRKRKAIDQSCLHIKHALSQREYVDWKYEELKNLCNTPPKEISERYRFRTFSHPYFTSLRANWYPNGIKVVEPALLKGLDALAVAVWFLDDGTNLGYGSVLRFASCSFSAKEHDILIAWLQNVFSIKTRMCNYNGYRMLAIEKESRREFIDLISTHVPGCMKRKVVVGNVKSGEARY